MDSARAKALGVSINASGKFATTSKAVAVSIKLRQYQKLHLE